MTCELSPLFPGWGRLNPAPWVPPPAAVPRQPPASTREPEDSATTLGVLSRENNHGKERAIELQ